MNTSRLVASSETAWRCTPYSSMERKSHVTHTHTRNGSRHMKRPGGACHIETRGHATHTSHVTQTNQSRPITSSSTAWRLTMAMAYPTHERGTRVTSHTHTHTHTPTHTHTHTRARMRHGSQATHPSHVTQINLNQSRHGT